MRVRETQIPGVGERFTVTFETGELVVLVRNEGDREVFWRSAPGEDADPLFETSEREARTLAEVFDGTYFEAVSDDVEDVLEDATIEWVEVDRRSSVVDRTIGEVGIRSKTGVTVLAVQRGARTVPNPGSEFGIEAGDVLVVVGPEAAHEALEALLVPE